MYMSERVWLNFRGSEQHHTHHKSHRLVAIRRCGSDSRSVSAYCDIPLVFGGAHHTHTHTGSPPPKRFVSSGWERRQADTGWYVIDIFYYHTNRAWTNPEIKRSRFISWVSSRRAVRICLIRGHQEYETGVLRFMYLCETNDGPRRRERLRWLYSMWQSCKYGIMTAIDTMELIILK